MKKNLRTFALVLTVVLAAGCGTDREPSIEEIGQVSSAITSSVDSALSMVDILDENIYQLESGETYSEEEVQQATEQGVDENGQGCVTFAWSGLSATMTFEQCPMASGEVLNGSVTLSLVLSPYVGIAVGCNQLSMGDKVLDGWMGLAASGPIEDLTISVGVDMSFDDPNSHLELRETVMAIHSGIASLDGQGQVSVDGTDTSFGASNLIWDFSDCLPTSGSLSFTVEIPVNVTFLESTPETGIVVVEYGNIGPFEYPLFPPCS
jgi:hypothetical protein